MERVFVIGWPDDLGPEWINEGNLRLIMYSKQHIAPNIKFSVEDITNKPDRLEEVYRIVIGALTEFAECYGLRIFKSNKEYFFPLVDDFIKKKGIKHSMGHAQWYTQCVLEEGEG